MRALIVLLCLLALSPVVAAEEAESGNVLIDVVLPLSLAFIMFSLGLGLTIADFQRVVDVDPDSEEGARAKAMLGALP